MTAQIPKGLRGFLWAALGFASGPPAFASEEVDCFSAKNNLPDFWKISRMTINANLTTAQYALGRVKEEIYNKSNFKSSNKTSLRKNDTLENERMQAASDHIDAIRAPRNVFNLKKAIWEGRGHNCGELASAAKYIAAERGVAACVVRTEVHGFAVIGDIPPSTELPGNMEHWPEHLAVCDPWVNIACEATSYPQKFIEKMEKWERDEKIIENPYSQTEDDGWIRPTDPAWTRAVLDGPKPG